MPSSLLFSPVGSSPLPAQLLFWKLPDPFQSESWIQRDLLQKLAKAILLILTASKWNGIHKSSFGVRRNLATAFRLAHLGLQENLCPHLFDGAVSVVADDLGSSVVACLLQKQSLGCVVVLTYLELAQATPEFSRRTAVCMRCESNLEDSLSTVLFFQWV